MSSIGNTAPIRPRGTQLHQAPILAPPIVISSPTVRMPMSTAQPLQTHPTIDTFQAPPAIAAAAAPTLPPVDTIAIDEPAQATQPEKPKSKFHQWANRTWLKWAPKLFGHR